MKKVGLFLVIIMMIQVPLWAQNELDALRYSFLQFQGTARFNGIAGAFGALGGDATTAMTNPAGIGVFRKSDLNFSLAYNYNFTQTTNNASLITLDTKPSLQIDNFAFIVHSKPRSFHWRALNFGITYSKSANFNQRFTAVNEKGTSSLLDVFTSKLNYYQVDPATIADNPDFLFGTNLAWQTYLIDTANGQYFHHFMNYNQQQSAVVTQSGSMGETDFNFSGNYDDVLYVGITFGFPRIRYAYTMNYQEAKTEQDTLYYFDSFDYSTFLTTNGTGFNVKLGAIARISDWVRIGAAWHSPTVFTLTDNWSASMTAYDPQYGDYAYDSPEGIYDYSLITPGRAIFSSAFIIDKRGLISIDYELVDYSNSKLLPYRNNAYSFSTENNNITTMYHQTFNLRAGGEMRFDKWFARGGISYYGNPYHSSLQYGSDMIGYSAGGGYRDANFYFDVAYVYSNSTGTFSMYDESLIQPFTVQSFNHKIMATVGFRLD